MSPCFLFFSKSWRGWANWILPRQPNRTLVGRCGMPVLHSCHIILSVPCGPISLSLALRFLVEEPSSSWNDVCNTCNSYSNLSESEWRYRKISFSDISILISLGFGLLPTVICFWIQNAGGFSMTSKDIWFLNTIIKMSIGYISLTVIDGIYLISKSEDTIFFDDSL